VQSCVQTLLDEKLALIDHSKNSLISLVKQTSAKLKFTLNGSVARDTDYLNMSLQSARERLSMVDSALVDAVAVLNKVSDDCPEINVRCSMIDSLISHLCLSNLSINQS